MNQLPQIELKTATKSEIEIIADNYYNNVFLSGDFNELEAIGAIVRLKELVKLIEAKSKNIAIEELEKYGKGAHIVSGVKFNTQNRSSYNYNEDDVINSIDIEIGNLKEKRKSRESLIKLACKGDSLIYDKREGDKVEPVTVKYSTSIIKTLL